MDFHAQGGGRSRTGVRRLTTTQCMEIQTNRMWQLINYSAEDIPASQVMEWGIPLGEGVPLFRTMGEKKWFLVP